MILAEKFNSFKKKTKSFLPKIKNMKIESLRFSKY